MEKDVKSLSREECRALAISCGEKAFRGDQLFEWLHRKLAVSFDEMTNLPAGFRTRLADTQKLIRVFSVMTQISRIDGTEKYAYSLGDGNIIETVLMRYEHGLSICISSQVGCRMGCRFCASTIDGLVRNLTPSEMLEQIYETVRQKGERVSNVVIMGSGEPLDNYDNVMDFIRLISDEKGYGMSRRNITLSTCGLVPKILELADEDLPITLAISLHAPNDELRRQTMPIANKYSIREILEACDTYFEKTGRRISFEYSLISDVNDSHAQAEELAALLKGKNCHVNLIPVNPIRERNYRESREDRVRGFQKDLENKGINATIRRRLGADIDSACGQLRRRVMS